MKTLLFMSVFFSILALHKCSVQDVLWSSFSDQIMADLLLSVPLKYFGKYVSI